MNIFRAAPASIRRNFMCLSTMQIKRSLSRYLPFDSRDHDRCRLRKPSVGSSADRSA
jgi:hypothetical protein